MTRFQQYYFIIISLIVFISSYSSQINAENSNPWQILSPAPEGFVKTGELFIAASLTDGKSFKKSSVIFLLDGINMTNQAKISTTKISLLYLSPVESGRHKILIIAHDKQGQKLPLLQWFFVIAASDSISENPVLKNSPKTSTNFEFCGTLEINSRNEFVSGFGSDIRQEPAKTNYLNFNAQSNYKSYAFPIKIFTTSDESKNFQPRNRFQIGVTSKSLELYVGDNNPNMERLILRRARVRGVQARLNLDRIYFDYVHGDLLRAVKGRRNVFEPGTGFAPQNLQADSTYISSGTFRRKATAARLTLGSGKTFQIRFTYFKAKDDTSSIKYGENPKENLVIGSDMSLKIKGDLFKLNSGAAISLTTNDISTGPSTTAEIDSFLDAKLTFDPADYDHIITLNTTTFPIETGNYSSLAWYLNSRLKIAKHILTAEYKLIGPDFVSFGNPYLRNDRQGYVIGDRFYLLNRKVLLLLRFQQDTDNLSHIQAATRNTTLLNSNISVMPGRYWPRFNLSYRTLQRKNKNNSQDQQKVNDRMNTFSLSGNYNIRAFKTRHGFNINFSRNQRSNAIDPEQDKITQTLSLRLIEQLQIPLIFNLLFMNLNIRSKTSGELQSQKSFISQTSYKLLPGKLMLSLMFRNAFSSQTKFSPKSNRFSTEVGCIYNLLKDLSLEMRFGYSRYEESGYTRRNYDEKYFVVRNVYGFNFRK